VLLHLSLVVFAVALLAKAAQVQLVQREIWAQEAERQHITVSSLPAPRGVITDERGEPLAVSSERVRITIAPNQVRGATKTRNDRDSLAARLAELGVSRAIVRKALDTTRKHLEIPGLFLPSDASRLMALSGVRGARTMERLPSGTPGIRRLIGAIDPEGKAQSGLELALDSLLTGTQGERRALRDRRGRSWDSPVGFRVNAKPGNTVRLTINRTLQEIIERELLAAMERTGASGGDLVVLDPNDGAILALAGARDGRIAPSVTPLTQAYQPGSVLKPMFVARLIEQGRTSANELVNTENGRWVVGPRTFTDEHKAPYMSVFDVVRWSSNIGTVKLVLEHMSPAQEYELLRDYGFGVPSGLPYPSETRGTLRDPSKWTVPSAASHAIGYELTVTPVQLAVAYAALANGGEMLEPALVREIRSADGALVFRHDRRVLRRVASEQSTAIVREMLKAVVDSGTGRAAGLTAFDVGGKSGTARRVGAQSDRQYDATFAGMFPMSDPQLVVVARLIEPQSAIFGGVVAGPMVQGVLRGAVAARNAALDRTVLAKVARAVPVQPESATSLSRSSDASPMLADARARVEITGADGADETDSALIEPPVVAAPRAIEPAPARVVVSLPLVSESSVKPKAKSGKAATAPARDVRTVPSVRGLTMREAVRTLHDAGFRVRTVRGVDGRTRPSAGENSRAGTLIVLETGNP
jgi:cell division protein FtsI (penicillin-binding protein 3)